MRNQLPNWFTDLLQGLPQQGEGWNPALMSICIGAKTLGLTLEETIELIAKHTPGGIGNRAKEIERAYTKSHVKDNRHGAKTKTGTVETAPISLPTPMSDPTATFLKAVFRPQEKIMICPGRWNEDAKRTEPDNEWRQSKTVEDWLTEFAAKGGPTGVWQQSQKYGVYVIQNPTSGGAEIKDITDFRHALIEFDGGSFEAQYGAMVAAELPFTTISTSGGKSIHAVVRVDAEDLDEYKERVAALYDIVESHRISGRKPVLDNGNKNANRYTRLPGALRGDKVQELLQVNPTPEPFDFWHDRLENRLLLASLPPVVDAADFIFTEPPAHDPIIEDLLDKGRKAGLFGSSKTRKSYLLLQLALSVAGGLDEFIGWRIPKARRVLLIQLEVPADDYHRRVWKMARALRISPERVRGMLTVASLRGADVTEEHIRALAIAHGAELIIVDPFYKVCEGDENSAESVKPILKVFDRICRDTGAALIFCHHFAKGEASDRQTIDRGAGSGVIQRDFDLGIFLSPHKTAGLLVCETVARAYPPQDKFTIRWDEDYGGFLWDETPPAEQTRASRLAQNAKIDIMDNKSAVLKLVRDGAITKALFIEQCRDLPGMSRDRARALVSALTTGPDAPLHVLERRGRGMHDVFIGTPEQIDELKKQ